MGLGLVGSKKINQSVRVRVRGKEKRIGKASERAGRHVESPLSILLVFLRT